MLQLDAFIYSGLFLTVVGFYDVMSWKLDCQLKLFMSNEFSYALQVQDPKDPKDPKTPRPQDPKTPRPLALTQGPAQKLRKGAGHYVLCQQSSFGVEESRSSIANYYILDTRR